ncbi:hypothetical protein B0H17DRAFT_1198654 [Mycena rosella]|uniref:Glycoside hydrolase family 76 protein n=1 Tax=Mycena rosella TaxID=1033263 RepID=A0AAD7DNC4_MYCRO|nr:hypothetical protein B0H17DRAFT_1198654 [Mycena rosella]
MLSSHTLIFGFLCATLATAAQLVSPTWRKPNITTSLADRVNIAGAALDKAISMLGKDDQFDGLAWGVASYFYSQIADFDIATNQTKYQDNLKGYFLQASQLRSNFSDELSYGHAAARAYAAYKDPVFLDYAVQSWWYGWTYTLSSADVASGSSGAKDFPIEKECQGITTAGGTFGNTVSTDPFLTGLGTGVSALLAEATSDQMYLQAATDAANFIHTHLYNVFNQVQDSISGRANDSCALTSLIEPYNAGLMMEGLSILYSITGNASIQNLLNDILVATIPNTAWQGSDGVIANGGQKTGDLNLVQGLTVVYTRNATTPELHSNLGQYIAIQFNAVIDLATENNSNVYGNSWLGPPSSVFSGTNQTNALSALIGAISLRNDSSNVISGPQSSSASAPSQTPAPHKSSRNASVIGGVIGGVALVAVVAAIWAFRRRFSPSRHTESQPMTTVYSDSISASEINPFREHETSPTSYGLPSQRTHRAKSYNDLKRRHAAESADAIPDSSGPSLMSNPHPASVDVLPQNVVQPVPAALPTEELVRLLNERLQGHEWDEGEAPPDYLM